MQPHAHAPAIEPDPPIQPHLQSPTHSPTQAPDPPQLPLDGAGPFKVLASIGADKKPCFAASAAGPWFPWLHWFRPGDTVLTSIEFTFVDPQIVRLKSETDDDELVFEPVVDRAQLGLCHVDPGSISEEYHFDVEIMGPNHVLIELLDPVIVVTVKP